jgi:hypothetical protein
MMLLWLFLKLVRQSIASKDEEKDVGYNWRFFQKDLEKR